MPKRRILKNLNAAFGESYSPATKTGIARGVQDHLARNLVDCLLQFSHPEYSRTAVTIEGLEYLEAALAKGNGVIALGAHIGNFVLAGTRLGLEGYPFNTLFRIPSDSRIRRVIFRHLKSFHQKLIPSVPRRAAVTKILQALKRNEIVFILGDNLKRGKVRTHLFGRPVRSSRGPASLALRSGAPVLPLYLIRNYQGGLRLVIENEIELSRNGNLSEDITLNTHRITGHLERFVRKYPDQWNWLTVRIREARA